MQTTLRLWLAISLVSCHAGSLLAAPEALPRFKARVACFNGDLDVSSFCSGTSYGADGTLHTGGKMTCGIPGRVSEITWSFVGRHGDRDVYSFARRFPVDAADVSTSRKEVEFSTRRVLVFQDEHQAIVIDPPKK